jgi:quercetin dioxygenase-like cupin family protein
MADGPRAVIVPPGGGHTVEGPVGGPLTFKIRGSESGGSLTALENVIPPGEGPPMHVHAAEDEAWYVIDGDLRFSLDGALHSASAGAFVFVPRGAPHCFQNVGSAHARLLVLWSASSSGSRRCRPAASTRSRSARRAPRRGWTSSARRSRSRTQAERS